MCIHCNQFDSTHLSQLHSIAAHILLHMISESHHDLPTPKTHRIVGVFHHEQTGIQSTDSSSPSIDCWSLAQHHHLYQLILIPVVPGEPNYYVYTIACHLKSLFQFCEKSAAPC